ncbi:BrnT family toxin [Ciceribacter selenitireducens]
MSFEWDETKNRINRQKHGISFEEACLIFDGSVFSAKDKRFDYGEERIISIGAIASLVIVVVVHTDRSGSIRIISARLANRKERMRYHAHLADKTEGTGVSI